MFGNDKYDRFIANVSQECREKFVGLTIKVRQEIIDHTFLYESVPYILSLKRIDEDLRNCYFDDVEPRMSRPKFIAGYWMVLCNLNVGRTQLDNMLEVNRIFCYYLMQMILSEKRGYQNEYFLDIASDIRGLAKSESLSINRMICMVEKIQESNHDVAQIIRKSDVGDCAVADGVTNVFLAQQDKKIVQGVILDDRSKKVEIASEIVLQPAEFVEASYQTNVILDRIMDIVSYDARLLSVLKNTCKWYSNRVSKWILDYRQTVEYENYSMIIRRNAMFVVRDNFNVDGRCVFHSKHDCMCEYVGSISQVFFLSRLISQNVNPRRLHQLLAESELLMNNDFVRLLFKMKKVDEWMVVFFLFHQGTMECIKSFFRYVDEKGQLVQMCHHYMLKVYERSRYWFYSMFGTMADRVADVTLYYSSEVKKRMKLKEYLQTGVYGLSFFQDFLNDDGDSFVSKRVLGRYKREINSAYRGIVGHFRSGGRPDVIRCCDQEQVSNKCTMQWLDFHMNHYFCRDTMSKILANKKTRRKVRNLVYPKNVNDMD